MINPNWPIFFRGVEATNEWSYMVYLVISRILSIFVNICRYSAVIPMMMNNILRNHVTILLIIITIDRSRFPYMMKMEMDGSREVYHQLIFLIVLQSKRGYWCLYHGMCSWFLMGPLARGACCFYSLQFRLQQWSRVAEESRDPTSGNQEFGQHVLHERSLALQKRCWFEREISLKSEGWATFVP